MIDVADLQRAAAWEDGVTRTCRGCGQTKPITEFGPHPRSPGRRKSRCRWCERLRQRIRRHGDPSYVTPTEVRVARQRNTQLKKASRKPDTYPKYFGRHEHRVVAERMLGRSLARGEIVHHRDGDKHNNSPNNLIVVTRAEHVRLHRAEMLRARKQRHGY